MAIKRISYSASFKCKVALVAIHQEKMISQFVSQFKVYPTMIGKWKSHLLERCEEIFCDGRCRTKANNPSTK